MIKKRIAALFICSALALSGCNSGGEAEEFSQSNFNMLYGALMETDNGYYYVRAEDSDVNGIYNSKRLSVRFCDKKTGKNIALCNKPECIHDPEKNPFCAAAGCGTIISSALYDNYVYTVRIQQNDNILSQKLYRTSLDGTEHTEVATVCEQEGYGVSWITGGISYLAIYGNKAFMPYQKMNFGGSVDFGVAMVDIKTGAVKKLNPYKKFSVGMDCKKLIPYENRLYYVVSDTFGEDPELYCYDISADKTERIEIRGDWRDYCIVDGKIVFLRFEEEVPDAEYSSRVIGRLYSLDPETKEERRLTDAVLDPNGVSLFLGNNHGGNLLYDGERFYTFNYERGNHEAYTNVYSKEGEYLASFTGPEYELDDWHLESDFDGELHILNGKVYYKNLIEAVYCPIEDILAGNVHWEPAFECIDKAEYENIYGVNVCVIE